MNVIIPRNSTIPVKAGEMFTTAVDNQTDMLIHVLQGERERAKDNWSLGKFTIEFEPRRAACRGWGCNLRSMPTAFCTCWRGTPRPASRKIVEMKSAVDVDDAAVQQMVEESVEHAFEDLAARRWMEAKLKAKGTGRCHAERPGGLCGRVGAGLSRASGSGALRKWSGRWRPRMRRPKLAIYKDCRPRAPRWTRSQSHWRNI